MSSVNLANHFFIGSHSYLFRIITFWFYDFFWFCKCSIAVFQCYPNYTLEIIRSSNLPNTPKTYSVIHICHQIPIWNYSNKQTNFFPTLVPCNFLHVGLLFHYIYCGTWLFMMMSGKFGLFWPPSVMFLCPMRYTLISLKRMIPLIKYIFNIT